MHVNLNRNRNIISEITKRSGIFSVLGVMYVNIYYMHDVVVSKLIDFIPSVIYSAKVYMAFDIAVILLFFSLLTLGKRKYAYSLTYFVLLFWELTNIVYSRFFNQYFIISALKETSNFEGTWWMSYVGEAFHMGDCLLLFTTAYFIYEVFYRKSSRSIWNGKVNWYCVIPMPLIILFLHVFVGLPWLYEEKYEAKSLVDYFQQNNGTELARSFVYDQELTIYQHGLTRTQLYCNIYNYSPKEEVSEEDINYIRNFLKKKAETEVPLSQDAFNTEDKKNIVFIFIESWLSCVTNMSVNGIEITPNLNRLAASEGTYYNGTMLNNKTVGESSDAQLLYFTGLYPLRTDITVSEILNKQLVSLPAMLKEKGYSTHITIPTRKYFWHQAEANRVYGVDSCYSTISGGWDNMSPDNQVFELAYSMQKKMKQPYFHVILTAAMHGPYTWAIPGVELNDSITSEEYPAEYCNYLQKCHYTDRELGKFLNKLKADKTFDKTIFVIAADHAPNINLMKMSAANTGDANIPLMIANARIDSTMTINGTINQVDVFPTLLDMLCVSSEWRGLGYSIFRKESFKPNVTEETMTMSEKIIYGDYFIR